MKNTILLFLLIGGLATAQNHDLGKVTIEELQQRKHPLDTSAVAAILFRKGEVSFDYSGDRGFEKITKVKTKIKIYKKEGYDWATFGKRYYGEGSLRESISFSKAVTYNLVGGKIEKTKLKSDGEFNEKINKYWNRMKITMPNVKEGSVIEFEYTIYSPQIGTIDDWKFQSGIPVDYSEFQTFIPEYLVYTPNQKGFIFPKTTKDSKEKTINYSYTTQMMPGMNNPSSGGRVNSNMTFKEHQTTYELTNVPALKDEFFVNNIDNYTSSISHELSMTRFPNDTHRTFSTDWTTVTRNIYENDSFGNELNKSGYFEDDLKTILSTLSTREEKIAAVYNHVKSKVKWNEYVGYLCEEGVRKAYKDGSGNSAEINLMLTAMLRYAGLDASPVLISTRSNGISFYPNRTAFNYVISAIEIQNGLILLDATSANSLPNILPIRDLNWIGRMIRKDGTSAEVDLMPKMISKDVVNLMATIASDGNVSGKVKEQHFDYNAYNFRTQYGNLNKDTQSERIEKMFKGIEIDQYDLMNKSDLGLPAIENYSFNSNNCVEIIGDKMYFSPMLFFAMSENPFKPEKRAYPIDFSFPFQDKFMVNITIPEGYAIETLPQSVTIPMSDNIGSLKYIIAGKDKQIQLSVTLDINSPIVDAVYYDELKVFYSEIIKKQTEKIVLKKA